MKVYISGKITGLDYDSVVERFSEADEFLAQIGFEACNPINNGLTKDHTWEQHMVRDIAMLLPCDAIYMMDNWIESTGARCEYHVANEMGKIILHENHKSEVLPFTLLQSGKAEAWRIYLAVMKVTGLKLYQFNVKTRTNREFFARLILVYNFYKSGIDVYSISSFISKSIATVYHCIHKYEDEFKYNAKFRDQAKQVNNILKSDVL